MSILYPKPVVHNRRWYRGVSLKFGYPPRKLLAQYLESPFWWEARERYRESGLQKKCLICDSPRYQLHHTDYRQLCQEKPQSLRPLCNKHHIGLHQTLNRLNLRPPQTDEALYWMARNFEIMDMAERLSPFLA